MKKKIYSLRLYYPHDIDLLSFIETYDIDFSKTASDILRAFFEQRFFVCIRNHGLNRLPEQEKESAGKSLFWMKTMNKIKKSFPAFHRSERDALITLLRIYFAYIYVCLFHEMN